MDNLDTNAKFDGQRQQILSIRREIRLLAQQVDYLLRNEKPLELLDVDVLMNRTHTLYDMLCAVDVDYSEDSADEDFDEDMVNVIASAVAATTGAAEAVEAEAEQEVTNLEPEPEPQVEEAPLFTINDGTPAFNEPTDSQMEAAIEDDVAVEVPAEPAVEPVLAEEPEPLHEKADDDTFVMYFEDMPANDPQPDESPVANNDLFGVEQPVEEKPAEEETVEKVFSDPVFEIVQPQGDSAVEAYDTAESLQFENDFDEPTEPIEVQEEADGLAVAEENTTPADNQPDMFKAEMNEPEVLGEKMMTEDNTLAAKLQNRPVGDLKSAIGINDKFLFVNELFGGSMEKYNRSIENLNDIQAYNGALIYLDELKVELQWNSSNMAYKKLSDLVKLKFNA